MFKKELVSLNPNVAPNETARFVSEGKVELKLVISEELKSKLDQLKELMSHKNSNMSYQELVEILANQALEKLDPIKKEEKAAEKSQRNVSGSPRKDALENKSSARYIPKQIKVNIWKRDQGKCTYVSPINGKRCESRHLIQIDHVLPFALGGTNQENNLRLLCAQHNQQRARETFRLFG